MPEPILSVSLILAGYTAASALSRPGTAVSPVAERVRQNASTLVVRAEESVALFGPKASAFSDLAELAIECAEPNWDGYGAEPVSPIALDLARQIIRSLSDDLLLPTFSIEPDGCVSLDWMPSRDCTFTLSAGISDRLPYAWIEGTDRGRAVSRFENGQLSQRIIQEIKRICSHDTTFRAA